MMKRFQLESTEILARVLGEKYGINVAMRGTVACTVAEYDMGIKNPGNLTKPNKFTIILPGIETMDKHYRALIRTFIDHEVGHVRYTNWGVLRNSEQVKNGKTIAALQNIIEDVYVEHKMMAAFPGCVHNFTRGINIIFSKPVKYIDPVDDMVEASVQYMLHYIRSLEQTGAVLKVSEAELRKRLEDIYGSDYICDLHRAYGVVNAGSLYATQNNIERAVAISSVIYNKYNKTTKGKKKKRDNNKDYHAETPNTRLQNVAQLSPSYNNSGDNTDFGGMLNKAMKDFLEKNSVSNRAKEVTEKLTDKYMKRYGLNQVKDPIGALPGDAYRALRDEVQDAVADVKNNPVYINTGTNIADCNSLPLHDAVKDVITTTSASRWYKNEFKIRRLHSDMRSSGDRIASKIGALIQSMAQARTLKKTRSSYCGDINYRAMWRPRVGRSDMFLMRNPEIGFNAEVLILVDTSGSMMENGKDIAASIGCYALAKSLARTRGVKWWIGLFASSAELLKTNGLSDKFYIQPEGGTRLQCGLDFIPEVFSDDPDVAKYVFILTDGQTCDPMACKFSMNLMKRFGVRFAGIDLMCDGLNYHELSSVCDVYEKVNYVSDLPAAMLRVVKKLIFRGAKC